VEVFVARAAVESTLASLATAHLDTGLKKRLLNIRNQLERVDVYSNPVRAVSLGRSLHDLLAANASNQTLYDFYAKLRNVAALTRNLSKRSAEIEAISRQDHFRIIDAVVEGDRDEAEASMRLHLSGTCERVVASYLGAKTANRAFVDRSGPNEGLSK
jgi:DNA-binding GntR family transcriptional regulator